MNEREQTMERLRCQATEAKRQLELVMDILAWSEEPALSRAADRLVELIEQSD